MEKEKIRTSWKRSIKGRKQRKFRALAPLHLRKKLISSNLSEELRKQYKKRSMPLRKEDAVKIMRGEFRGKNGKVLIINMKNLKIYIEGIQRSKRDGTKVNVPIDPSNVQITSLNLDDKKRMKFKEEIKKQK